MNAEFREPWCVDVPSGADLVRMFPEPGGSCEPPRMAICHLVLEGRCWVQARDGQPVPIGAGDVVVLPHGDVHLLGSTDDHGAPVLRDAVALKLPELAPMRYGGDGSSALLVCGWFRYEQYVASPVMGALPPVFRTNIRGSTGTWLEDSLRYAVAEAASGRPGSTVTADKLAEVLFVEALRGYLRELPAQQTGWLAGLRDPLVGRTLALMHERPAEAWTVASLAQASNTSRTVLADRFVALVGVPPMQYLTQWRMAIAADLLRANRTSLIRIAEHVGYESEAAFSRAFKREYGAPPARWRRNAR